MATIFPRGENNFTTTLAADHAIGGRFTLPPGVTARLSTASPLTPYQVTVARQDALVHGVVADPAFAAIYRVEAIDGDDLIVAAVLEDSVDQVFYAGDAVYLSDSAGLFRLIFTAINLLEGGSGTGEGALVSGILKGNGAGGVSAAVAGTDYLAPAGDGSLLTGLTMAQIAGLVAALTAKADATNAARLTGADQAIAAATAFDLGITVGAAVANGFVRFGGATAAFPALVRTGTKLECLLADLSGYAPLQASEITAGTGFFGDGTNLTGVLHPTGPQTILGQLVVGDVVPGSANAQLESRAASPTTPIFAGYRSDGGQAPYQVDPEGNLRFAAGQLFRTRVPTPNVVGNATVFGTFDLAGFNGSGALFVTLTINGGGNAQTKLYQVVATYSGTPEWAEAIPLTSTGPYTTEDCALDVHQLGNQLDFRVRRVSGTIGSGVTATLSVLAFTDGYAAFTASGVESAVTPPTIRYLGSEVAGVGGNFRAGAGIATAFLAVTSNTTLDPTHSQVMADATGGAFTLALPLSTHKFIGPGRTFAIKNAGTANDVTLAVAGADVFDDGTTSAAIGPGQWVRVLSDGAGRWYLLTAVGAGGAGGGGDVAGILKGDGGGTITAAVAGTDYLAPAGDGSQLTALDPAALSAGTAAIAISGNAATATTAAALSGSIAQSQVVDLETDLALLAPRASPALTGVPTAPTATAGTSTTQVATTAFVTTGLAAKADATATTTALAGKAPLDSPALTGVPTAPTAGGGTNTTQVATTAFVAAAVGAAAPTWMPAATKTTAYTLTAGDGLILADAAAGGFALTLPDATTVPDQEFVIKKIDATANVVTIARTGGQLLDGAAADHAIDLPRTVRRLKAVGSEWWIL